MATTVIGVESKATDNNSVGEKVMEMRLVAQNKNASSITNPYDKRAEEIKAPFSEIVQEETDGGFGDLIV